MIKNSILFLDFETYYDTEYSLRRMPIPNYLLDPRYETIMCAVKVDGGPSEIVDGPDFPKYIAQFDAATTTTVAFNALFDGSILGWHYGFLPRRMLDTMGMARALRGHILKGGSSLKAVAEALGLGAKGDAIVKVMGMRREDIIRAGLWPEFKTYAKQDNDLNYAIFLELIREFPQSERRLMDLVLRCCIEPKFLVDCDMLVAHIGDVQTEKAQLLSQAGITDVAQLMSNAKFQTALESLGVLIEYKTTPTGRTAPAFAKTDDFMAALLEHEDPRVQMLAAARVGHKSTIEETRAEKLLSIGRLPWSCYRDGTPRLYSGGTLPIPLAYGKAHTHRLAGEWGMNMQNLPTKRGSKGKSKLRNSLVAPPGHKVLTADLGQIEARLVAWICKALVLLKQFADKLDPYAALATQIFCFPVDRKVHIVEGFIGKTGILGLGYGCGDEKFDTMVRKTARAMELDISAVWKEGMALTSVRAYRRMHHQIPAGWRTLDGLIDTALIGGNAAMFGPVRIEKGRVALPNGLFLNYADLRKDEYGEVWYRYGKFTHKLYGAKLMENIVQALARIVVMNAALRISDRGYNFRLQAHDELVFIVPDADLENAKKVVHIEMVRPPSWAPDIPLTADVGTGQSYGEAK